MDWAICRACVGPFGGSSSLSVLVKTLNGKKAIETHGELGLAPVFCAIDFSRGLSLKPAVFC